MIRKVLVVLSLLVLVSIFISYTEGRVSDKEWRQMKQEFINKYEFSKAKGKAKLRAQALQVITNADHPGLVKLLVTKVIPFELNQKDPLIVDLIVNILNQLKDKEAIDQLIKSANKTRPPAKVILIRGMARINDPDVINSLIEFIGYKKPGVQIAAIDALAPTQSKEALQPVIKALDAEEWQVRASAINYLAKLTDAESKKIAIEVLIARLSKESGRLKGDIKRAISVLAGSESKPSKDNETIPRFYGVDIESKHLVFVVDVSGSMICPAKEGGAKIEVLRKELTNVVKKLPVGGTFNIVIFHQAITGWKNKLVSVKKYRKEALDWIEKEVKTVNPNEPLGGTNIYDALERAFGYGKKGKSGGKTSNKRSGDYIDVKAAGELDTIFFMSDGVPNFGKYTQPDEILKVIKELNQTRKIKIHTIAVGVGSGAQPKAGGADPQFMRKLAEENGGTYKEQ